MKLITPMVSLLLLLLSPSVKAVCYTADPSRSDIEFTFSIEDSVFKGHFADFNLRYCWDNTPEDGEIDAVIAMQSVSTGNRDLDIGMQETDGLATQQYPKAYWQTEHIEKKGGEYVTSGRLTIREITRNETGRFQLVEDEAGWLLEGKASIHRLNYELGSGEYADISFIPDLVTLQFTFHLMDDQTLQKE